MAHPAWRRRLWPYLAVAFGFFFSRSVNLQRAAHHIALWIPLFAMVSAAGVGAVIEALEQKLPNRRLVVQAAAFAILPVAFLFALRDGAVDGRTAMQASATRLVNVDRAFQWMYANLPPKSNIYTSFYCFGPDTFYDWMRELAVPVPEDLGTARYFRVWWWDRSGLRGKAGYACVAPELDAPIQRQKDQSDMLYAAKEAGFHRVKEFGEGNSHLEIYQFDLK